MTDGSKCNRENSVIGILEYMWFAGRLISGLGSSSRGWNIVEIEGHYATPDNHLVVAVKGNHIPFKPLEKYSDEVAVPSSPFSGLISLITVQPCSVTKPCLFVWHFAREKREKWRYDDAQKVIMLPIGGTRLFLEGETIASSPGGHWCDRYQSECHGGSSNGRQLAKNSGKRMFFLHCRFGAIVVRGCTQVRKDLRQVRNIIWRHQTIRSVGISQIWELHSFCFSICFEVKSREPKNSLLLRFLNMYVGLPTTFSYLPRDMKWGCNCPRERRLTRILASDPWNLRAIA